MSSDNRDARAIAAIPCPRCNAAVGKPCNFRPGDPTRVPCCSERRKANQQRLDALEPVRPGVSLAQPGPDYSGVATEDLNWNDMDDRRELRRRHRKGVI